MKHLARAIERRESHPVRMQGQGLVAMKQQVERLVELDVVAPRKPQPAGAADLLERRLHRRRVDGVRAMTRETQQYCAVGAVPLAGQGEGAVDLGADARRLLEQAEAREVLDERARRVHRTHRVRARGPDADLEDIQHAQVHKSLRGQI